MKGNLGYISSYSFFKNKKMAIKICPECGVPRRITKEHLWLDNGTMVERKNIKHRMGIFDVANIVDLFQNIEEIIGLSIEHITIESTRKAVYDYVVNLIPPVVKPVINKLQRYLGLKPFIHGFLTLNLVLGSGNASLNSVQYKGKEDDFLTLHLKNPSYLPIYCGQLAGAMEAVTGYEISVTHKEISPDEYLVTAIISTHPKEMEERLQPRMYSPKEGDIELEVCPVCGGPMDLSQFKWDLDRGTIEAGSNRRRMIITGTARFDAIFDELEKELGENIPLAIIEAQRRFMKEGFYDLEDIRQEKDLRKYLALRGLGNLREMELDEEKLRVGLENACMYPVITGMMQGLFELVFGRDGEVEWEISEDGDLEVEVNPK